MYQELRLESASAERGQDLVHTTNVISGDKETYVKDLSEMWIKDALTGRLDQTYIFRVLLE
jgi:hypothetical protein